MQLWRYYFDFWLTYFWWHHDFSLHIWLQAIQTFCSWSCWPPYAAFWFTPGISFSFSWCCRCQYHCYCRTTTTEKQASLEEEGPVPYSVSLYFPKWKKKGLQLQLALTGGLLGLPDTASLFGHVPKPSLSLTHCTTTTTLWCIKYPLVFHSNRESF